MSLEYSKKLSANWQCPNFSLNDTEGEERSISEFTDKKGCLIFFTCNHCPYTKASWPLIIKLNKKYGDKISFAAINSNDVENYPDDSYEAMQEFAKENNLGFPYLHDKSQELAKSFLAQCTPDIYLFKTNGDSLELFYHGGINDNWQDPGKATRTYLEDAISSLLNDEEAPEEQPPSMGCSIKWK